MSYIQQNDKYWWKINLGSLVSQTQKPVSQSKPNSQPCTQFTIPLDGSSERTCAIIEKCFVRHGRRSNECINHKCCWVTEETLQICIGWNLFVDSDGFLWSTQCIIMLICCDRFKRCLKMISKVMYRAIRTCGRNKFKHTI